MHVYIFPCTHHLSLSFLIFLQEPSPPFLLFPSLSKQTQGRLLETISSTIWTALKREFLCFTMKIPMNLIIIAPIMNSMSIMTTQMPNLRGSCTGNHKQLCFRYVPSYCYICIIFHEFMHIYSSYLSF